MQNSGIEIEFILDWFTSQLRAAFTRYTFKTVVSSI